MATTDFDLKDLAYLEKLISDSGLSTDGKTYAIKSGTGRPTPVMRFRRLLLAALEIAPADLTVQRLADSHLTPITADTREFARAMHRICLILRSDGADSSGVLIGPDLILTAAHALRGIRGIFADPANVRVCFDRLGQNPATPTGPSSCGLRPRSGLPNQPDVVASSIKMNAAGTTQLDDNLLDYVVIRLDRPIGNDTVPATGRKRGWVDGSAAHIPPPNGPDKVSVLQHPRGLPLHYARGHVLNTRKGRIHYKVDVAEGSSGAAIFDRGVRIVGIHTGQVSPVERIGISFQDIFRDANSNDGAAPLFPRYQFEERERQPAPDEELDPVSV